jgi:hypothetical protein
MAEPTGAKKGPPAIVIASGSGGRPMTRPAAEHHLGAGGVLGKKQDGKVRIKPAGACSRRRPISGTSAPSGIELSYREHEAVQQQTAK